MSAEAAHTRSETPDRGDLAALGVCALIWGSTWLVLKFQLGTVDPILSIILRFLASGLLIFPVCLWRGERIALSAREHGLAAAQGALVFGFGYVFGYAAETHAPSAVVAVVFASLALVNTLVFRIVLGQKVKPGAWAGAVLGTLGVAALSAGRILGSPAQADLLLGVGLTLVSVFWSMIYGAGVLTVYGLVTHVKFIAPTGWVYWSSFAYLTLLGSVTAFLLYYSLAQRRGFTLAAYTGALTPPIAMLLSSLFEQVRWDLWAFVGLALIVSGQVMIIRQSRAA